MLYIHRTPEATRPAGRAAKFTKQPWVARITGLSPKFGMAREFVPVMRDHGQAHQAKSGRLSGVIATFALQVGWVCEVAEFDRQGRLQRRFVRVEADGLIDITATEAMEWAASQPPSEGA
jgi:hypothetical protein